MTCYIKGDVATITGLSSRQVQFYTEELHVKTEYNSGNGRGNRRKYSKESLVIFMIIKQLINYGITKPVMSAMLHHVLNHPYLKIYSDLDDYENLNIYLCFYTFKSDVIKMEFIIPNPTNNNLFPSHSSSLIINFGEIIKRVNKK